MTPFPFRLSLTCKRFSRFLVANSLETLFNAETASPKCIQTVVDHASAFTSVRTLALPKQKDSKAYYETLIRFLIAFKSQLQQIHINFDDKLLSVHRNAIVDNLIPASLRCLKLTGANDLAYKQLFQLNLCNLRHLSCPLTEKLVELSRTTTTLQTLTIDVDFRAIFSSTKRATEPAKKAVRALCSLVASNPNLELLKLHSPRLFSTFAEFLMHLIPKFDTTFREGRGLLDQMEKLSLPVRILRINGKRLFEHCLLSNQLDFSSDVFEDMWSRGLDPSATSEQELDQLVDMLTRITDDIKHHVFAPIEKLSVEKINALEAIFIECQKRVPAENANARIWGPFQLGTLQSYLEALLESCDDIIDGPDVSDKHKWWKLMAQHKPEGIFTRANIKELHATFFKFALDAQNADFATGTGLIPNLFDVPQWWVEVVPNGVSFMILEHPHFDPRLILERPGGQLVLLSLICRALEEMSSPPPSLERLIKLLEFAKDKGFAFEFPLGFSAYTEEPHWCLKLHHDETLSRFTMLFFEVYHRALGHVRGFLVTNWFEMGGDFAMVTWLRRLVLARGEKFKAFHLAELDKALWYAVLQMTELDPQDADDLVLSALEVAPPPPEIQKLFSLPDKSFTMQYDGYTSKAVRLVQTILLAHEHG